MFWQEVFMKNIRKVLICGLLILAVSFVGQPVFAAPKVNLNTATAAQLIELKGIGEKTAQHIIEYREKKKFETVDELIKVKGIGPKTMKRLQDQVTVGKQKKKKKK
jgi:competence protein ComEA